METGDKCDLCGVFYEFVKSETWRFGHNQVNVPECGVVFALVHGDDSSKINICEACYANNRIESELSREQARVAFKGFGLEFSRLGQFEKAKTALMQSLQIGETAGRLASLAYVEDYLGNRSAAIELYLRALAIDPNHFMSNENLKTLRKTN